MERLKNARKMKTFAVIIFYIILLNITISITILNLQIYGHLFVGGLFGCPVGKIVFDVETGTAQTLLECNKAVPQFMQNASAFFFVLPFALLFLLIRGFPEMNLFFVILGLNMAFSQQNLAAMFGIPNILTSLVGIGLFIFGEMRIVNGLLNNYNHLFSGDVKVSGYYKYLFSKKIKGK